MATIYRAIYLDPKTGERRQRKRWYVRYRDGQGRMRNIAGCRGRAAAAVLEAVYVTRLAADLEAVTTAVAALR